MEIIYTCKHCYKEYKRKSSFDRHILVCELIKRKKITNDDDDDTPSTKKLYEIILELAKKNDELEQKVNKLTSKIEKWIDVKKKKINILEWLNHNIIPTDTYEELTSKMLLSIDRRQLEKIFEYGHVKGYSKILYSLFENNGESYPVKAFEQNNNCLYIFDFNIETNKNEWYTLSNEMFNKFLNNVSKLIMKEYITWKDENKHRLVNDNFAVECNTNLLKVLGGQMSIQEVNHQLKLNLYKHLKTNIKNVIEFDFTF